MEFDLGFVTFYCFTFVRWWSLTTYNHFGDLGLISSLGGIPLFLPPVSQLKLSIWLSSESSCWFEAFINKYFVHMIFIILLMTFRIYSRQINDAILCLYCNSVLVFFLSFHSSWVLGALNFFTSFADHGSFIQLNLPWPFWTLSSSWTNLDHFEGHSTWNWTLSGKSGLI